MTSREIVETRDKISAIFTALNIRRVICIDDNFAISVDLVAGLLDLLIDLGNPLENLNVVPGLLIDASQQWRRNIPGVWKTFNTQERRGIFDALLTLSPADARANFDPLSNNPVSQFCPEESISVEAYPPSMWPSVKEGIISFIAEQPGVILCLFDRNFDADPHPYPNGIDMLKDAITAFPEDRVICGLLSQTFKTNEELTEGKKLANDHHIPANRFIPLAKERLDTGLSFVDGIRLSSLMLACAQLAHMVSSAASSATEHAKAALDGLSVHDFHQVILKTSEEEGIWEVETLLRLFGIYLSSHLKQTLYDNRTELTKWTKLVRNQVVQAGPEMNEALRSASWRHSKLEYYESGPEINRFHLPLELGDIFKIGAGLYILLGQSCDLAIRNNGKRSAQFVTLVEIAPTRQRGQESTSAELKFLGGNGETAFALFKRAYPISLDILDLTTLNADGKCAINLTGDLDLPPELPISFRKRFENLHRLYTDSSQDLVPVFQSIDGLQDEAMRERIKCSCLPSAPIPGFSARLDLVTKTYGFGVERVARFRQPRVSTLLQQWAAYIGRPALDRDFEP